MLGARAMLLVFLICFASNAFSATDYEKTLGTFLDFTLQQKQWLSNTCSRQNRVKRLDTFNNKTEPIKWV